MANTYYLTDSSGKVIAAGSKEYTQEEAAKYYGSGYIVTPTGEKSAKVERAAGVRGTTTLVGGPGAAWEAHTLNIGIESEAGTKIETSTRPYYYYDTPSGGRVAGTKEYVTGQAAPPAAGTYGAAPPVSPFTKAKTWLADTFGTREEAVKERIGDTNKRIMLHTGLGAGLRVVADKVEEGTTDVLPKLYSGTLGASLEAATGRKLPYPTDWVRQNVAQPTSGAIRYAAEHPIELGVTYGLGRGLGVVAGKFIAPAAANLGVKLGPELATFASGLAYGTAVKSAVTSIQSVEDPYKRGELYLRTGVLFAGFQHGLPKPQSITDQTQTSTKLGLEIQRPEGMVTGAGGQTTRITVGDQTYIAKSTFKSVTWSRSGHAQVVTDVTLDAPGLFGKGLLKQTYISTFRPQAELGSIKYYMGTTGVPLKSAPPGSLAGVTSHELVGIKPVGTWGRSGDLNLAIYAQAGYQFRLDTGGITNTFTGGGNIRELYRGVLGGRPTVLYTTAGTAQTGASLMGATDMPDPAQITRVLGSKTPLFSGKFSPYVKAADLTGTGGKITQTITDTALTQTSSQAATTSAVKTLSQSITTGARLGSATSVYSVLPSVSLASAKGRAGSERLLSSPARATARDIQLASVPRMAQTSSLAYIQRPAQVQRMAEITRTAQVSRLTSSPAQITRPVQVTRPVEIQRFAQVTRPAQITRPVEITRTMQTTRTTQTVPTRITQIIQPPPIIPPTGLYFRLPRLRPGPRARRRKTREGRLRSEYAPSLEGVYFNIKQTRIPKLITGLSVRGLI